jgi:hypothetical protein
MDLEAYELVMLRRPADATDYDEATLEEIQRSLHGPGSLRTRYAAASR